MEKEKEKENLATVLDVQELEGRRGTPFCRALGPPALHKGRLPPQIPDSAVHAATKQSQHHSWKHLKFLPLVKHSWKLKSEQGERQAECPWEAITSPCTEGTRGGSGVNEVCAQGPALGCGSCAARSECG